MRLPVSGCLLLSAICLASIASAQMSWQRTYGGQADDVGASVQQTSDGGFIVAGRTQSFGAGDDEVYLVKTNASGDTFWTRTYGGSYADVGNSVQQTTDSGFIIAGCSRTYDPGGLDVYLIKTDARGDTFWTRTYGGAGDDVGYSVKQTSDFGYIVVGSTSSYGAGASDVYLIKTDAQGDTLWTRTYGGADDDEGYAVQQTPDGGFMIVGYTSSFGAGNSDVYLIKADSQGDTLWTRTYGGPGTDEGFSAQQTADGGYVIAGFTDNGGVYLIKTDASGDTQWAKAYREMYGGCSVQQTADRGYIVAVRSFYIFEDDPNAYLIKTDAQGDTLWTRTYGGTKNDRGNAIRQTRDSGYVVAGWTYSFGAGNSDVYLIKTNGLLDVGPVAIQSPPGVAESGSANVPMVVVRNFGLTSGSIVQVTMEIGSGYSQTVQETLVSVPLDTVVFPAWTAEPVGSLGVTCFTSLVGDEDPTNDTIRGSVQVLPPPRHDVGAVAILSPSGTVRASETVIPRARLRNFGNRVERFFNVQFRIGANYSRTANAAQMLYPDSTVELTFAPWVADSGNWAVSCSTMLVSDANRANDKVSSSVQVFAQSLAIEPDQSDRLAAGKSKTYRFYAQIQGDTGGVVEVAQPFAPTGWSLRLGNATGGNDLTDTDGDGIPDLGYVAPGESGWFSLDVTAPSELLGDTASIGQRTFLVAGHVGGYPLVADTAVLNLTLMPTFSAHNFPNPFSDHTTFVIGLPDNGQASLTVYTRAGERVCRVLENADMTTGVHVVRWDGVNDNGRSIAPGTYEYLLDYVHAGKTERIRKKLVVTRE
jgi:hypothetical protein